MSIGGHTSRRDFEKAGIVFGGGQASARYYLLCKDDVVGTLASLQGKRVRTPGGGWSRVISDLGMVPVAIAWAEIYTAQERGAVDCIAADASTLNSGPKTLPLTKSVIMLPLAPYFSISMHSYNPEFWSRLTSDQRKILLKQTARAMVRQTIATESLAKSALEEAKAAGVAIVQPGNDLESAYQAWIDSGMGGAAEIARKDLGIEDPDALFDAFALYVEKWSRLLEGVDRENEAELLTVLNSNLIDRIDAANYGID